MAAAAVTALALLLVFGAYSSFYLKRATSTDAERSILTASELPDGPWEEVEGQAATGPWLEPEQEVSHESTFVIQNRTDGSEGRMTMWIVLEKYNTTEEAQQGFDDLTTELNRTLSNVTEVALGDRALIFRPDGDTNATGNVSILVILMGKFTSVVHFEATDEYVWTLEDTMKIGRLQADKIEG